MTQPNSTARRSSKDKQLWRDSAFFWFRLRHNSEYHRVIARQRITKAKALRV